MHIHRLSVSFALMLTCACGTVHNTPDAGAATDAGTEEPCPDLSCEDRCAAVSVCNCAAPGGEADCARRGGVCEQGECALLDAGPELDAGARVDAGPELDASPDGALDGGTDAGADGGIGPVTGVPCGAMTCGAGTYCAACEHSADVRDAHCLPSATDGWVFNTAGAHECGFPSVFAECDGHEDCESGELCTFTGGEWGFGQCWARDDAFGAIACREDSDCEAGVRCGEVDPYGYFSPLFDVLGWRPTACGGASAAATEFCDRFDAACGIGAGEDFDTRERCLGHLDGLSAEGQTCAFGLLAEAEAGSAPHCTYASSPATCE